MISCQNIYNRINEIIDIYQENEIKQKQFQPKRLKYNIFF